MAESESNPWCLIIEPLLHLPQVDLSIILRLIKSVPDKSDELGRNVRDLIAIWVLETLYARETRKENSSVPRDGSQTEMDVSRFCEEVVKLISQEAAPVNRDVPSLISQKRSCVQNCSLYQLKSRILERGNPILKLLKDGSGLEVPDENRGIPVDGDASNGIADERGVCKSTEAKRKLSSITGEDDGISEEYLPVKELSPAKRVRNIAVAANCELASPEPSVTFEEPPKKCALSGPACQNEQLGELFSRAVYHIEQMGWETGPEVHSAEETKGKEDSGVDPGVVFRCHRLVPYDDSSSEDTSGEEDAQASFSDKDGGGNGCAMEPPPVAVNVSSEKVEENGSSEANDSINIVDRPMSKDNDVHVDNLEIASDSGEYHDIMTDIGMEKNYFLSSQGIDTQDSSGTQLNRCVKCEKGRNLLSCSSSSCRLVAHKECLGSAIDLDTMGNFYCPFCAYSRAIARCQEAKKKYYLTRTDLTIFHVFRADLEEKSSSKRSHGSKKHGSSETENINQHIEPTYNHDTLNEVIENLIPPTKLDDQVEEPSKSGPGVEAPCGENEKSCSRHQEVIPGREMHNRMSETKELLRQSDSDATCVPESTDCNAEESFNAESVKNDAPGYCIRPHKLGRQIKNPSAQLRKKLTRTNVEEQSQKVFEFNPVDPKDKWSSIRKGSPRSK